MTGLKSIADTRVLRNGVEIPCMGFDTRTIEAGEVAQALIDAVKAGFRFIATADYAENTQEIAKALKSCGLDRAYLFIASSADIELSGYDETRKAIKDAVANLGIDYLDLYLVHLPEIKYVDGKITDATSQTWKALEDAYNAGEVKAIGVCSMAEMQLEPFLPSTDVMPMVDQIELHPRCNQPATLKYCQHNDIAVEAWMPFGDGNLVNNPAIIDLGLKYSCSPAQICLRWAMQRGAIPLPSTTDPIDMGIFADVFRFSIDEEDMAIIDFLDSYGDTGLKFQTHDN